MLTSPFKRPKPAPSALAQLAAAYGMPPDYVNAMGKRTRVAPEVQIALLQRLGIPAQTEDAAAALLAAREQALFEAVLPPVVVARPKDGVVQVSLQLSEDIAELAWSVHIEGGEEMRGLAARKQLKKVKLIERGGVRRIRAQLAITGLPLGYHRLRLDQPAASTALIVAPSQAYLPEPLRQGGSAWGISTQLYLMRSARNWGMGDFTDLADFVRLSAEHGCGAIGLNPLHMMFLDHPEHASPYSPAHRSFLNVLYIDPEAVPEWSRSEAAQRFAADPATRAGMEAARHASSLDYRAVARLKMTAFRHLYEAFQEADEERKHAFATFRAERGETLERVALFEALRAHFGQGDPSRAAWQQWPEEYRHSGSEALRRFAAEHRDEVDFHVYLQWVADEQLGRASAACGQAGMDVGLYGDLAVGCDQAGAETWVSPEAFVSGVEVGAPPDIFNPHGQNWGLAPLNPLNLQQSAYQPFVELVRANMRHSGALRIDHVAGLMRLWWIPQGNDPRDGAYIRYPLEDLLGILALESHRNRCLVIGEDLGTVPPGLREGMESHNILTYKVLIFEQDYEEGHFLPPKRYPRLALAVSGNHDLAPLKAWWTMSDLETRKSVGIYHTKEAEKADRQMREDERKRLVKALRKEGLLPRDAKVRTLEYETVAVACYKFLGRTKALLALAQLDDMTREDKLVNVPATTTQYPNWRRKYGASLEELATNQRAWGLAKALAGERQAAEPLQP